jgi:periplasmic copper chaperone A
MKLKTFLTTLALTSTTLYAQTVDIKDAWVRASVQGQMATGAFMKLTAKEGVQLISVTSPVAGIAEVHEMKMEGDVMKMRAVSALSLPAGKMVELKPGSYHVMLMDLKTALKKDSTVPMTLLFKDAAGQELRVQLQVPVAVSAPGAMAGSDGHSKVHPH